MHPATEHSAAGLAFLVGVGDAAAHGVIVNGLPSLGTVASALIALVYVIRAADAFLKVLPGRIRAIRAAWGPGIDLPDLPDLPDPGPDPDPSPPDA